MGSWRTLHPGPDSIDDLLRFLGTDTIDRFAEGIEGGDQELLKLLEANLDLAAPHGRIVPEYEFHHDFVAEPNAALYRHVLQFIGNNIDVETPMWIIFVIQISHLLIV